LEDAHTAYVTERCATIHDALRGPDEKHWIDELDATWPDVRAVVRRAFDRDDVETIAYLVPLFGVVDAFYRRPEVFAWGAEADARYHDVPVKGRHNLLAAASTAAWLDMNIDLAVELGEAAIAADPAPGAGDCQPQAVTIGAYIYAGRFADAAELAQSCLPKVSERGDLYGEAYMVANLALSLATGGLDAEGAAAIAARAVRIARAIGNQTLLGYTLFALASVAGDDPEMAAAATREAHAAALNVSNRWVLLMTNAFAAGVVPGEPIELAALLDVIDTFYRSGWVAHAWTVLGNMAGLLFQLDRDIDAALVIGACEASDLADFKSSELPAATRQAIHDDSELNQSRQLGAHLSIPEVLRLLSTS
jgi:hypothetical protein